MSDSIPGSRRLALVLYALSVPLAFPHELPGGGSIDLGLVFVWLIPASLAVGIEGRPVREAGRVAFVASLVGHFLLFHWFYVVTVVYGGMDGWLGLLAPLAPALYISLFSALFAMGWVWLRRTSRHSIVLGAAIWVVLDWARAHFMGGFPWATLGYGLHADLPLLALARWTGVYGLSFVAAAVGLAIAQVWIERNRVSLRTLVLAVALALLAHGVGLGQSDVTESAHHEVRIAAVQGNIDQGQKWDRELRSRILEKYLALSERAVSKGAQWVVWPETAVPGLVELDPALEERLAAFATRHGVVLVVGGMGVEPGEDGRRIGAFFDSAFVIDREGRLRDRYDKTQLVPFGEFVPLRALLGRVFEALATGLSNSDVTAGQRPRVLQWEEPGSAGPPLRVAVPICYELLFPHTIGGFGGDGAGVMLAITNDAWYGRTGAPHQFLAMTAMRAAENGRFVVRAANTGLSAIIDDRGRVWDRSALFEDAIVIGDVPISLDASPTFYARFGDVFVALCGLAVLGVLAQGVYMKVRYVKHRNGKRPGAMGEEVREG